MMVWRIRLGLTESADGYPASPSTAITQSPGAASTTEPERCPEGNHPTTNRNDVLKATQ